MGLKSPSTGKPAPSSKRPWASSGRQIHPQLWGGFSQKPAADITQCHQGLALCSSAWSEPRLLGLRPLPVVISENCQLQTRAKGGGDSCVIPGALQASRSLKGGYTRGHLDGLFSSVQLLSRVRLFATPWSTPHQASLSITSSRNLLKLMSTESVMSSNHLILCHPLLLLPSIFPSIRVFSNE